MKRFCVCVCVGGGGGCLDCQIGFQKSLYSQQAKHKPLLPEMLMWKSLMSQFTTLACSYIIMK